MALLRRNTKHICNAVGCNAIISRTRYFCREHWSALPESLRRRLCATYRRGQNEGRAQPTEEWDRAMKDAQRTLHKT